MEKKVYYAKLYDYYGNLLTVRQQGNFEDYYFNDLTLKEIADNHEVSRNAISKTLKEVLLKLDYYEENIGLLKNKKEIEKVIKDKKILEQIDDYI